MKSVSDRQGEGTQGGGNRHNCTLYATINKRTSMEISAHPDVVVLGPGGRSVGKKNS